ncbi:MAG TPA: hypothetical protein VN673_18765 [Clostridia bacterium]|nr:hypothetical protein [Clostridia bacterium]
MNGISAAFWIYVLTIVFALSIALLIQGMGVFIKKLNLDREETLDISVPSSDSIKENQLMAVAIAAAHARNQGK